MYGDEEILTAQSKTKNLQFDLSGEIMIDNFAYTFEKYFICDKQASMQLPKQFIVMPDSVAVQKYPSAYRPKTILTTENYLINLGFSQLEEKVWELPETITSLRRTIKNLNPSYLFMDRGTSRETGIVYCFFDYRSYSLNGDLYNLMFMANAGPTTILGSFNCPYDSSEEWGALVKQLLKTIQNEEAASNVQL